MTVARRRMLAALVAAAVLLGALWSGSVGQTSAAWSNSGYLRSGASAGLWRGGYMQLRLSGTSLCLDVPNRDNFDGRTLQVYACNSTPAQVWTLPTNDLSVRVYASVGINAPGDNPTPRCLEYQGVGVAVEINACGTVPVARRWTFVASGDGYQLRNNSNNGRCLDVPSGSAQGAVVVVSSCTANNRARVWIPEPVNPVLY